MNAKNVGSSSEAPTSVLEQEASHLMPLVDQQRRLMFIRGAQRSPVIAIVMISIIAYLVHSSVGLFQATLWAGFINAIFLIRFAGIHLILKDQEANIQRRFVDLFICGTGFLVAAAGFVGLVFWFPTLTATQQGAMSMAFVGWMAGGMASQGSYPKWTPYWTLPLVTSLVISWSLVGGVAGWSMSFLGLIVFVLMAAGQLTNAQAIRDSILAKLTIKELIDELNAQKSIVEETARTKASFLVAAGHDLRQPAMGLGLLISALKHAPDLATAHKIGDKAEHALSAMERILQSLLDFSRLDSGQIIVSDAVFNLKQNLIRLVDEVASLVHPSVEIKVDASVDFVRGDQVLVEQIIRNFLSNAVRFTYSGSITLTAQKAESGVVISVVDTGIGISPENQINIFKEYFQVNNAVRSRAQGLGLGLSIVEKAAKLLGGHVEVRSEIGKGSTFSVFLPLAMVVTPMQPTVRVHPPLTKSSSPTNKRLLVVVDDDPLVRESFQIGLEVFNFDVAAFADADATIQFLEERLNDVSLIFVDYQISSIYTGLDVVQTIQSRWPFLRCVLVTGDVKKDVADKAKELSIPVLYKPLRADQIIDIASSN